MTRDEHPTPEASGQAVSGRAPRLKRALRRLGIALLVLFVICGSVWTYFYVKYGRMLRAELDQIRAAGEPVTVAELVPKPVPADRNAAVLYQEVFRVNFEPGQAQPKETGFDDIGSETVISDYLKKPGDPALRAQAWELLTKPEARRRLDIIRQASLRPDCVFPVHWEAGPGALFPQFASFRQAARWVVANAQMLATQGRPDEALEWEGVGLRMSRHAGMSTPMLIGELASQAVLRIVLTQAEGILSGSTPSAQALEQTLRTASDIDPYASCRAAMMGERVCGIQAFGLPARALAAALGGEGPGESIGANERARFARVYCSALAAPIRRYDEVAYLKMLGEVVAAADRPLREVKGPPWLTGDDMSIPRAAFLTRALLQVSPRITARRDWTAMRLAQFEVALELKLHRQQRGSYPPSLEEVEKALGRPLPRDPFSGGQFAYQRQDKGFALAATGLDTLSEQARNAIEIEDRPLTWQDAQ